MLARRLDRALELWQDGVAPLVVTTGSNQPGDRVTEGFAGFEYLRFAGIPEENLLVITDNTLCPLIPFAHLSLVVPSRSIPLIGYPTTIFCIINYLMLELVNRQDPQLKEYQEKLEQMYLENDVLFNVYTRD